MTRLRRMATLFAAAALPAAVTLAADPWEPDDSVPSIYLHAGDPPLVRELVGTGAIADVDWMWLWQRSYRSYDLQVRGQATPGTVAALSRWDFNRAVKLQDGSGYAEENFAGSGQTGWGLRWKNGNVTTLSSGQVNNIRVQGQASSVPSPVYTIQFRESTLFCPRFNNAGTQASVLILQASPDGVNTCEYSAHFFSETGNLLATVDGTWTFNGNLGVFAGMAVHSLPSVAGLEGQKGAAQIAHTCGYGNLKGKLVALEPATGFSFDTLCSPREQ